MSLFIICCEAYGGGLDVKWNESVAEGTGGRCCYLMPCGLVQDAVEAVRLRDSHVRLAAQVELCTGTQSVKPY